MFGDTGRLEFSDSVKIKIMKKVARSKGQLQITVLG